MEYHVPVMAKECLEGLAIKPDGIYVDVTFGGGGHSRLILEQLGPNGRLIAFDQDADAVENAIDDPRFTLVHHNFKHLKRFLRLHDCKQIDGILADLGVSSHQLNEGARGFSYRFDADLDMRMNQKAPTDAKQVINDYSAEQLWQLLGKYGEVRNAKQLANTIVQARNNQPITTIFQLIDAIDGVIRGNRARYLAQVFQALRIEVNSEMEALEQLLEQSLDVLAPGGRFVVMSYHSLEDRLVKRFLKTGNTTGEKKTDFYGNIYRPFKLITSKAVLPTDTEIAENSRARSAKLRIGEKL